MVLLLGDMRGGCWKVSLLNPEQPVWTLSPDDIRRSTAAKVTEALTQTFAELATQEVKTSDGTYRVEVRDVRLADPLPAADYNAERRALMGRQTYGSPIVGDVVLYRNGKVVDTHKGKRLAVLPHLTNRFSYIVAKDNAEASEVQVTNLLRQRHGLYTTKDKSGVVGTYLTTAGHGIKDPKVRSAQRLFDLRIDGEGAVRFRIRGSGVPRGSDSSASVVGVLKAMGMSDQAIADHLGPAYAANQAVWRGIVEKAGKESTAIENMLDGLARSTYPTITDMPPEERRQQFLLHLRQTELDPVTSEDLLGRPYKTVTAEALAAAARNLVRVSRGDRAPDDRISLAYQKVLGPDDLLADTFRNKRTRAAMLSKVRQRLNSLVNRQSEDRPQRLARDVLAQVVQEPMSDFFGRSELNDLIAAPGMNPLAILSEATKITPISDSHGGVASEDQVKDSQKQVNPSHVTFLDPLQTPEGSRSGITLHMAVGTKRATRHGVGVVQSDMYDRTRGKLRAVTPAEVHKAAVALPEQYNWVKGRPTPKSTMVKVQRGDRIVKVRPEEVDFIIPQVHLQYSVAANLVPFMENNHANRASMGTKQSPQAVSLVDREAPYVQVASPNQPGTSFEKAIGTGYAAVTSPIAGTVRSIHVDEAKGEGWVEVDPTIGKSVRVPLYVHYPLREHGQMHSEVRVKVGDKVAKGGLLADSGYTKNGVLALGKNLLVGYMPWHGLSFDDGIVVSESAAKKLTSRHLHEEIIDLRPEEQYLNPAHYASVFKDRLRTAQVEAYNKEGVIQQGQTLMPGQVLNTAINREAQVIGGIKVKGGRQNQAHSWKGSVPARVVGITREEGKQAGQRVIRYKVLLETLEPLEVGDKIVSRHANKGVVTKLVPDAEMPRTVDGRVMDVLYNPAGVPGRMNVGQLLETALGKLVEKKRETDPDYTELIPNFSGRNNVQWVLDRLKAEGLSDQEPLINPQTNRPYGGDQTILVGSQYVLKLKHQIDKKVVTRNAGAVNPSTGTPNDGRALGELNFYTMLAHNARDNLYEMTALKSGGPRRKGDTSGLSDWNQSVYQAIVEGSPIPKPDRRHPVWDEFESYLRVMGVRLQDEGDRVQVVPLTDAQLKSVSKGALGTRYGSPAQFKRGVGVVEEPGSLYDPILTGGRDGENWTHFDLGVRLPKPMYARSIAILLGLPYSKSGNADDTALRDVLDGKLEVNGRTGAEAIVAALKAYDVDGELKRAETAARALRPGDPELSPARQRVRVLRALKSFGVSPLEAYTTTVLPVVPPRFRPLREKDGLAKNPLNRFYGDVAAEIESYKTLRSTFAGVLGVPESAVDGMAPLRERHVGLYEALKAMHGLTGGDWKYWKAHGYIDPGDKGIVPRLVGTQPKRSFYQEKFLKRMQDFSGGSVIIPNPKLGLDQIGIPEAVAWGMYEPFVIHRLRRSGTARSDFEARELIKTRAPAAENEMRAEMAQRPILFKRDPTLHKYGIMAFQPVLVTEREDGKAAKAIQLHPLVTAPFNADFDGDQGHLFLPITERGRVEAQRMYPSRNIFGPATGLPMFLPSQEALLGLNMLTEAGKETKKVFASNDDVLKAFRAGDIKMDDVVSVGTTRLTAGRLLVDAALPEKYRQVGVVPFEKQRVMTKGTLKDLLLQVGKEQDTTTFARVADRLKDLGYEHVTTGGFSISLSDLLPLNPEYRAGVVARAEAAEDKILAGNGTQEEKDRAVIALYRDVDAALDPGGKNNPNAEAFKNSNNRLFRMVRVGSKGTALAVQQMVSAPVLVMNAANKVVPVPILKSYGEGLDASGYAASLHGARKGIIQKVQEVRDPGKVSKQIMKATQDLVVTTLDCGTSRGIDIALVRTSASTPADLLGRYLTTGELVTDAVVSQARKDGKASLRVRSALTCEARQGLCSKCLGLNENGNLYEPGTNAGVISGQSIGEPLTQLSLRVFHSGGVAKGKEAGSQNMFRKLEQLVGLPVVEEKGPFKAKLDDEIPIAAFGGEVSEVRPLGGGGWQVSVREIDGPRVQRVRLRPQQVEVDVSQNPSLQDLIAVDVAPLDVGTPVSLGERLTKPFVTDDGRKVPVGDVHLGRLLNFSNDLPQVQDLLVDEIHGTMLMGANENLLRRHSEVVVRALTDRWEVEDPGEHPTLLPGDYVRAGALKQVAQESGGTAVLRPRALKAEDVPKTSDDWQVRLQATELKRGIMDAAEFGLTSMTRGLHPVPAFGYGLNFSQGARVEY